MKLIYKHLIMKYVIGLILIRLTEKFFFPYLISLIMGRR